MERAARGRYSRARSEAWHHGAAVEIAGFVAAVIAIRNRRKKRSIARTGRAAHFGRPFRCAGDARVPSSCDSRQYHAVQPRYAVPMEQPRDCPHCASDDLGVIGTSSSIRLCSPSAARNAAHAVFAWH